MEQDKVDMFILKKGTLFPSPLVAHIRDRMLRMEDEKWGKVSTLQFRNPTIALLLALGCGVVGADRFYLGDWLLGCLKLLCYVILAVTVAVSGFMGVDNLLLALFMLWCVLIVLLWYFIDLFLVMKKTKELNYNKLSTILN